MTILSPHALHSRRLFLIALSVGLAVVASGCFSFLHPGSTSRTIDAPVDVVFTATKDVLQRQGFPIVTADRERGRIVTGRRPVWVVESRRRVEQADVELRPSDGGTRVRLLLTFVDQASGESDGPEQRHRPSGREALRKSLSAGALYDDYLDAIEDRVHDLMDDRATASGSEAPSEADAGEVLNVLETG